MKPPHTPKAWGRFDAFVYPEPNTGCWLWGGDMGTAGYGDFVTYRDRKRARTGAHRYAFERYVGPIPAGMFVCHTCDVRACVNPDHLFVGTHVDNMRDMARKGRNTFGTRHGCCRLTPEQVRAIRRASDAGATRVALSRKYGVSESTVRLIAQRRLWRHLDEDERRSA